MIDDLVTCRSGVIDWQINYDNSRVTVCVWEINTVEFNALQELNEKTTGLVNVFSSEEPTRTYATFFFQYGDDLDSFTTALKNIPKRNAVVTGSEPIVGYDMKNILSRSYKGSRYIIFNNDAIPCDELVLFALQNEYRAIP